VARSRGPVVVFVVLGRRPSVPAFEMVSVDEDDVIFLTIVVDKILPRSFVLRPFQKIVHAKFNVVKKPRRCPGGHLLNAVDSAFYTFTLVSWCFVEIVRRNNNYKPIITGIRHFDLSHYRVSGKLVNDFFPFHVLKSAFVNYVHRYVRSFFFHFYNYNSIKYSKNQIFKF